MSIVSILYSGKASTIGSLQLDVTTKEQHNYENKVSLFPVEEGSDISDNIRQEPDTFTIEGLISSTPIAILDFGTSLEAGKRVINAQDALLAIAGRQRQGKNTTPKLVTIVTGLRVHTNMGMVSLNTPRDGKTGQALRFVAKFVKVETVSSETVKYSNPKPTHIDKTQSKIEKGSQTPTPSTPETTTKASWLYSLFF